MKNCNKVLVFIIIILLLILNMKYYDKIIGAYGSGISNGYSDATFKQTTAMNRAGAAEALYSLVGNDQSVYPDLSDYKAETISYSSAKTLAKISGSWRGANSSLGHVYYTAYLDMKIQDGILETADWQVSNPGFDAKIMGIDEEYIYIKILEAEGYPVDWKLKTQDKIQYEYYSDYELRLKYNETTCIFYRQRDLSDEQIKRLKQLVNTKWINQNNSNLSVSFSYYDIELYDATKKSDDKITFSGRTYFKTQNAIIDVIPDITVVKDTNPMWTGIEQEKIAELHYRLSEDAKTLTLIYKGKEAIFNKQT